MKPIVHWTFLFAMTVCLTAAWPCPVAAGTLDAFEADAKPERKKEESCRRGGRNSCIDDALGEIIFQVIGGGMLYGGVVSWARVASEDDCYDLDCIPREMGTPLIPFARFDFSYQDAESTVDANDYRFEGGFGPFGVHFNQTHYKEASPEDSLDLIRVHGLYRMSFGSMVEVDLGLGALTIDGNDRDTRFSLTLPVRIYPYDWLGVEVRPAWADGVTDWDVALLLTAPFTSMKAGYRWVSSPNKSLNGPYVGLAVHF
ncbi:MAG: hypothetical protein HN919_21225 [Verrucomicrobia bacterium]|jgi:hypothetical protein|nr:hypothetical protein [Verrucomicrobiota bacterium]MBT7068831.1 hypothetical protein [Verrucomicrobiota bacterium]MBT7699887.1 hypothetical protein [Verrucomicrobiota bacterium]